MKPLSSRLRPSPERFAAAAALYDNAPMLQLRAAQSDDERPRRRGGTCASIRLPATTPCAAR